MEVPFPPLPAFPHQFSSDDSSGSTTTSMSSSEESEPHSETEARHLSLATRYEIRDPLYVASASPTTTATSSETDDAIVKSLQKSRKRLRKKRVGKTTKAAKSVGVGLKFERARRIMWLLIKGSNGQRWEWWNASFPPDLIDKVFPFIMIIRPYEFSIFALGVFFSALGVLQ